MSADQKAFVPDKALCAKMLRFGKQAYQRGRYLDAKEYFRKAVQADPFSSDAWRYYDLAAVFALAEKVEQDVDILRPGASSRQEDGTQTPPSPVPAPQLQSPEEEQTGFTIVDDEGC